MFIWYISRSLIIKILSEEAWTGADISENQIAEAVRMANEAAMKIHFIVAPGRKDRPTRSYLWCNYGMSVLFLF